MAQLATKIARLRLALTVLPLRASGAGLILVAGVVLALSSVALAKEEQAIRNVPRISIDELKTLMERDAVLVIDVRDPDSFAKGRIPGAVNIDYTQILKEGGRFAGEKRTIVAYESPHRTADTLGLVAAVMGDTRAVCVAREMTKMFEQFWRGTAYDAQHHFSVENPKGEITLIIAGAPDNGQWDKTRVQAELQQRLDDVFFCKWTSRNRLQRSRVARSRLRTFSSWFTGRSGRLCSPAISSRCIDCVRRSRNQEPFR